MNKGKVFEDEFKASVPKNVFLYRLPDAASGFAGGKVTRFALKNPFDFFMFSDGLLMPLELKTTEKGAISFDIKPTRGKSQNMIKWHQIEGLREASENNKVRGGFLLQFRDKDKAYVRTYWISIGDFLCMMESLEGKKKSCNEKDLKAFRAFEVFGQLKRTRYVYDIGALIQYIGTLENLKIPKRGGYSFEIYKPKIKELEIDFEALRAKGVDI